MYNIIPFLYLDSQDATGILTKPSLSVTKQKHHRKSQDEKDKNVKNIIIITHVKFLLNLG